MGVGVEGLIRGKKNQKGNNKIWGSSILVFFFWGGWVFKE